ncbi:MAG TPA: DUF58 domain-containing protein, partial [Thermoleophilaceae bacterium]|nr:DUF58 domain-containing protein [Thermoleophilaceae bacterium]
AVGATAWVLLAAAGARLVRRPGPHTVVEEEPYPVRIELRSGWLPPPGGELLDPLLGWPVPIGGRRLRRVRINVRFSRRGRRRLEPGLLVIADPLRLCVREVRGEEGGDVLVLPRIEQVRAPGGEGAATGDEPLAGAGAGASGGGRDASAAELEIDGLRPYRPGAPASRIHWPTVARTGEIVERRLVAELDSAPLVVLDAASPASDEALDMAVRAAGSLSVQLARASGCALLLPGDRRPVELGSDLSGWSAAHVRLALIEAGAPPPAMARAPRGGAVLWVTASDARRPPRVLERLAAGSRFVVTPFPLSGYPAAFSVAGCTGQALNGARRTAGRRAA